MKKDIKLIALDLDGTLFTKECIITEYTKQILKDAVKAGITVVISTGRPYVGLPLAALKEIGISYAITTNGAAIYKVPEKEVLFENCMDQHLIAGLMRKLLTLNVHNDVFINGDGYTDESKHEIVAKLPMPEALRHYIGTTRTIVPDLASHIENSPRPVQKITLNFLADTTSSNPNALIHHDEVLNILKDYPELHVVSGGYGNLELTENGISKSKGLAFLCNHLNIAMEETMACGDSENDLDIVKAAGIGVAMANASELLKENCDYLCPKSNEEDGVAYAVKELAL